MQGCELNSNVIRGNPVSCAGVINGSIGGRRTGHGVVASTVRQAVGCAPKGPRHFLL